MGSKTYEKRGYTEQTCEGKNKTNKNLGFLGNGITHIRTSLCTHNQAYVRRVDHVYVDLCPANLKNAKIEQNLKQQI